MPIGGCPHQVICTQDVGDVVLSFQLRRYRGCYHNLSTPRSTDGGECHLCKGWDFQFLFHKLVYRKGGDRRLIAPKERTRRSWEIQPCILLPFGYIHRVSTVSHVQSYADEAVAIFGVKLVHCSVCCGTITTFSRGKLLYQCVARVESFGGMEAYSPHNALFPRLVGFSIHARDRNGNLLLALCIECA